MDFILRLKNWQMFLIILFLPLFFAIGLVAMFDFKSSNHEVIMKLFSIGYYTIFMLWNYRVIKAINKIELILKPNQLKRLDWSLIVVCIGALFQLFPTEMRMNGNSLIEILSFIIMVIFIYSFFFIVFCTAKTLKGIQLKDQVRAADIIVEMIVIFYFPIGIWWLQKKMNRFLLGKSE